MRRVSILLIGGFITLNAWSSEIVTIKTVLIPFKEEIISGSVNSAIEKNEF